LGSKTSLFPQGNNFLFKKSLDLYGISKGRPRHQTSFFRTFKKIDKTLIPSQNTFSEKRRKLFSLQLIQVRPPSLEISLLDFVVV